MALSGFFVPKQGAEMRLGAEGSGFGFYEEIGSCFGAKTSEVISILGFNLIASIFYSDKAISAGHTETKSGQGNQRRMNKKDAAFYFI